jgi:hypothetical protein
MDGPALAAMIVAYDFPAQALATLGPIAMGACRGLSLLMGVEASRAWCRDAARGRAPLGAYVAGLTLIAAARPGRHTRPSCAPARALRARAARARVRGGRSSLAWSAATAVLAGPAVAAPCVEPSHRTVGPAVGALIRAIPALDGAFAGARRPDRPVCYSLCSH